MTNWLFSDIPNGPIMSKVQYNVSGLVYIVSFLIRRQRKMKVCDPLHLIYDEPVWYHFILLNDKNEIFKFLKYTKDYRLRLWVHKENCKYIRARADFVEWLEKNITIHIIHCIPESQYLRYQTESLEISIYCQSTKCSCLRILLFTKLQYLFKFFYKYQLNDRL